MSLQETFDQVDGAVAKAWPALFDTLLPPASEDQIRSTEASLGLTFPDDLRAMYRWHNGQRRGWDVPKLLGRYSWYNLDDMVARRDSCVLILNDLARTEESRADYLQDRSTVSSDQKVLRDLWNDHWIPLGDLEGARALLMDLAPGPAGVPGQLIRWEADELGPRAEPVSVGFVSLFLGLLAGLANGELVPGTRGWEQAGNTNSAYWA
jgi:cell wall assembly regulator SMI1